VHRGPGFGDPAIRRGCLDSSATWFNRCKETRGPLISARFRKSLTKNRDADVGFRIIVAEDKQKADPPHPFGLLCESSR
jgi:hypothetical protein